MPENNFEKQVKHIMEEFSVTPSDVVWQNVEADIKRNAPSKKRWVLASIFFVCCMLPSLWLNDLQNVGQGKALVIEKEKNLATGFADAGNSRHVQSESIRAEIPATNKTANLHANIGLHSPVYSKSGWLENTSTNRDRLQHVGFKKTELSERNDANEQHMGLPVKESEGSGIDVVGEPQLTKLPIDKFEKIEVEKNLRIIPVSILQFGKTVDLQNTMVLVNKQNRQNGKKMNVEISAAAGRFQITSKPLLSSAFGSGRIIETPSSDMGTGGIPVSPDTLKSNVLNLKSGNNFALNLSLSKNISHKSTLSAGIGVRFASTKLVSITYLSINNTLYGSREEERKNGDIKNSFYFIDFPIQFSSLIGKGRKVPVYWNTSFVYSYLLVARQSITDAVAFTSSSNDFSLKPLNKHLLGFSAGIDVELFKNKKTAFKIGPSFYYCFSKTANSGIYSNNFYQSAAISLRKTF